MNASYPLQTCRHCAAEYDSGYADWCDCGPESRSLRCPGCMRCFCDAGAAFEALFWSAVPAALRAALEAAALMPRSARLGHV